MILWAPETKLSLLGFPNGFSKMGLSKILSLLA